MKNLIQFLICGVAWIGFIPVSTAQSTVKGHVKNQYGDPLAFASIYIDELNSGIATNEEGYYETQLAEGRFTFVVQFLGYRTKRIQIEVGTEVVVRDIELKEAAIQLQTVVVTQGDEDPAYSIMRKAIAKAKFHTQQLDWHRSKLYIKSSFRTDQIPKLFRKRMLKEGFDTAGAYVEEAISEITYTRPNEWHEKVISRRTIGNREDNNPLLGITGSLYQARWGDIVTPFSPKAFAYYRYKYEGHFEENGYLVNKIKVEARGSKENLLIGYLYIVDQLWAIHSCELTLHSLGFKNHFRQLYQAIEPQVWLPISHKIEFKGKIFGFGLDMSYFITHTNYEVKVNPDLEYEPEIIDTKTETDEEVVEKMEQSELDQVLADIGDKEKLSNKDMRRVMKAYEKMEKEEARQDTLKNVDRIRSFVIDSTAYDKDSTYWEAVRPIPLSSYEQIGYKRFDSLAKDEDSTSYFLESNYTIVKRKFQAEDIIGGGNYKLGDKVYGGWGSLLEHTHFNTVEGWNVALPFSLYNERTDESWYWRVEPQLQYAFSRDRLNGNLRLSLSKRNDDVKSRISINVGRRTRQFYSESINAYINDFYTILFEKNFMKLYEREFIDLRFRQDFSNRFRLSLGYKQALNRPLVNNANHLFIDSKNRQFTSNSPTNSELGNTAFDTYKSGQLNFELTYYPTLTSNIYNGKKYSDYSSSPRLNVKFNQSIEIEDNSPSYSQWEIGIKHRLKTGAGSVFRFNIANGGFWNTDNMRLAELKHFPGNRTDIIPTLSNNSYKLLDYYEYSTSGDYYLTAHLDYEFRELLLTRLVWLQLLGIKENVSLSWLETDQINHYAEVAYGINYIFRFLKVEAVAAYDDFSFKDWGIRIGLSVNL